MAARRSTTAAAALLVHVAEEQDHVTAEALRSIRRSHASDVDMSDANHEPLGTLTLSDDADNTESDERSTDPKSSSRSARAQQSGSASRAASLKKRKLDEPTTATKTSTTASSSSKSATPPRVRKKKPTATASSASPSADTSRSLARLRRLSSDRSADATSLKPDDSADTRDAAPLSSSNVPPAYLATLAFVNPRDFFVLPTTGAAPGTPVVPADAESSHIECTLCQAKMSNRVYSLKRHLYRHHPSVFHVDEATSPTVSSSQATAKVEASDTSAALAPAVVQLKHEPNSVALVKSKSKSKSSRVASGDALAHMRAAYVAWLSTDVIPLPALASAHFRAFVERVNPQFAVPDVVVTPQRLCLDAIELQDAMTKPQLPVCVMRGLCITGSSTDPTLRTDVAVPVPQANDALIRIRRAGICGTDLMMLNDYKPGFRGVIGHEFVGVVEQLGPSASGADTTQWLGQRVVGEINVPCDDCSTCRCAIDAPHNETAQIKRRNHCPHRAALGIVGKDGVFAEFITLPLANLHVVPDSVVDAHAVFAEPLAAACRVVEQRVIAREDRVAVLGDGKLGLLVAEVLFAQGIATDVTLIGKHAAKLALMKHAAAHVRTLDELDASGSDNGRYDVCIECTGTPGGIALALQLVRRSGVLVMKSTCAAKESPVDLAVAHAKRVRVIGSRCGPFDMAMTLLRDRKVDVQKFIHGVYPLSRAREALAHAAQRGALKIQVVVV